MLFFAVAIKIAIVLFCALIVWSFYGAAELRRIGCGKLSAFAIACAAFGLAINLGFSPSPVWKREFLTSGAFTDDATLLLLAFSALVQFRVLALLLTDRPTKR